MATLFTVGSGNTYLTINSAAGGANLLAPNPDTTVTTIFLTTAQVRQLGTVAGFHIATGYVASTIAGILTQSSFRITPDSFNPPVEGVNVTVPLSGTGAGQNYVQYLTYLQTEQLFLALTSYSVTSQ
jgi:hypothetical protein